MRLTLEYFYLPGWNLNTENYFCIVKWPMFTNINHAQNCSCMCTTKTCDNKFCFVGVTFSLNYFQQFLRVRFLIKLHILYTCWICFQDNLSFGKQYKCTALNELLEYAVQYMVELLCSEFCCWNLFLFFNTAGHQAQSYTVWEFLTSIRLCFCILWTSDWSSL